MVFMGVGCATVGEKCRATILCALGDSTTGIKRCTPNEFLSEPLICLNLGTFISANDKINTKNAMSSVAMSANVAIQAGAPALHSSHSSHAGHSGSEDLAAGSSAAGASCSGAACSGAGVFASSVLSCACRSCSWGSVAMSVFG
jgi:hypothetical protein